MKHLDNAMQAIAYSLGSVVVSYFFPDLVVSDDSFIKAQLEIVVLVLQIAGLTVALLAAVYKLWKSVKGDEPKVKKNGNTL